MVQQKRKLNVIMTQIALNAVYRMYINPLHFVLPCDSVVLG